ncbi:aminoglycoside phosphotransferase family protein [Umezawaea sp. Da 62-37]|uniref:aminoglycoside phosphotransferase family protein n=1 Tax=Umezawaea sp. Da 62-37 TaxID=3075927 RepID=UPI0028F735C4|nr:aminoglycoside phosphotransferase family protein [Umezawaea sp. Da 62-37]WNV87198.1 aminoglycoside phosphotransferase family protein [Umezawaea sp. Da 62-37]
MIVVPPEFALWRSRVDGAAGRAWVASLPELVERLCARWAVTVDEAPVRHGGLGLAVMVHRAGVPCVLKLSQEAGDEATALTAWNGHGAVRLFEATDGALLLERLDPHRTLHDIGLWKAAEVAGGLIRKLAVPAPTGLPCLDGIASSMAERLPPRQQALGSPVPSAWLDTARGFAADLPGGDVLVHADLHYGNVLAGSREPWLAVDPRAIRGCPEFSVPELMWTRADDVDVDSDTAVRRLLRTLVDAGGLDAEIAHGWAVARCVDYWLWGLEQGLTIDPARCERVLTALLG